MKRRCDNCKYRDIDGKTRYFYCDNPESEFHLRTTRDDESCANWKPVNELVDRLTKEKT